MSDVVISVEGLSKRYTLGAGGRSNERYTALRDVIANKARSLFRPSTQLSGFKSQVSSTSPEDFWALRDVSFEVRQGEVVGIIGRNGAGKSTLLKILSRITDPTEGRIKIKGRVASLLEVGTGFHPELTGRENIFLNGAILGMSRAEIKARFDEIVAFAEVEKFLDTPVKRYSSGMYVRLAFAVAAHLEPEILIVDEVLAVGDAEFQKKCLGKMQDVSKGGRTVLFVSHNMDALRRICQTGILLGHGRLDFRDKILPVINQYLFVKNPNFTILRAKHNGITEARISSEDLLLGRLRITISFSYHSKISNPTFGLVVYTEQNVPIFGSNTLFDPPKSKTPSCCSGTAVVVVDPLPLWSGTYRISLWLSDGVSPLDHAENLTGFNYVSAHVPSNIPPATLIGATRVSATWGFSQL